MRALTTTELNRMQGTQESAMMDTCVIERWAPVVADEYGYEVPAWSDEYPAACGLDPTARRREVMGRGEVPAYDAQLRLEIDTELGARDRIRITHRFGVELDEPDVFEVVGTPRRGPSGLVVDLKRLTDGSDG